MNDPAGRVKEDQGQAIPQRESILRVLEDGSDEFAELRGVLVEEHAWRVREGLV